MSITLYHNNQCSKSRSAVDLLNQHNVNFEVIEYCKTPLNKEELKTLIQLLKIKPEGLVRKNEAIYKELFADKKMTSAQWITAMVKYPKLIERPIVLNGDKAIIGRPVELILTIL